MAKKTNKKSEVKSLPSALTVANPAAYRGMTPGGNQDKPARKESEVKSVSKRVRIGASKVPVEPLQTKREAPLEKTAAIKSNRGQEVTFLLIEPDAREVCVCGSFNDWEPGTIAMARNPAGCWIAAVSLAPGRYEYKFVVDGKWMPDLRATENVLNEFGTLNSVIHVG